MTDVQEFQRKMKLCFLSAGAGTPKEFEDIVIAVKAAGWSGGFCEAVISHIERLGSDTAKYALALYRTGSIK